MHFAWEKYVFLIQIFYYHIIVKICRNVKHGFDGFVQDCGIYNVLFMEILKSTNIVLNL